MHVNRTETTINRDDWTGREAVVMAHHRDDGSILVSTADFSLWLDPIKGHEDIDDTPLYSITYEGAKLGAVGQNRDGSWVAFDDNMDYTRDGEEAFIAAARLGFMLI